ncbi:hypothetical protein BgiBS90_013176, partial [Biomphalaria glabrata]
MTKLVFTLLVASLLCFYAVRIASASFDWFDSDNSAELESRCFNQCAEINNCQSN